MPDSEIVVVSDQTTCNYFREENKALDLSCSFSKDYSSSLLEDVSIILGGIFCFQLNAGGICVYPIFSELPYLFVMVIVFLFIIIGNHKTECTLMVLTLRH